MDKFKLTCPAPLDYEQIVIAHGGGGRLTQQLLGKLIHPLFSNSFLDQQHDSAVMPWQGGKLAFTTDSYVIKPLFFPGGDIGKLAVCGTLNDLAMSGARPLYLSCGLIMEEGLAITDLQRILQSMQQTAAAAGVQIVTGDCKVVDRGKGDGLYINTSGIGLIEHGLTLHPTSIRSGDAILVNSDVGRHGIAVMLEREGLNFQHHIVSDCTNLADMVMALLDAQIKVHCLRDATRGGLASILLEIAQTGGHHLEISEADIPIHPAVVSACEILGLDPLYSANEGCFVLFVPASEVEQTLAILKNHPAGRQVRQIGTVVTTEQTGQVNLKTNLGISRSLSLLSGEQLPRIC